MDHFIAALEGILLTIANVNDPAIIASVINAITHEIAIINFGLVVATVRAVFKRASPESSEKSITEYMALIVQDLRNAENADTASWVADPSIAFIVEGYVAHVERKRLAQESLATYIEDALGILPQQSAE